MKAERNAPCPCGSGLKYKRCCALKREPLLSRTGLILVVALVVGAAAALILAVTTGQSGAPGQVWSQEHGHYHTP